VLSGAAARQLLEGPGPSCGDSEVQALWEEEEELTSCGCVLLEVVGTTERSEDGTAQKYTFFISVIDISLFVYFPYFYF